eukprot:scaffold287_cov337-Pavlova_lutheri.AAC.63
MDMLMGSNLSRGILLSVSALKLASAAVNDSDRHRGRPLLREQLWDQAESNRVHGGLGNCAQQPRQEERTKRFAVRRHEDGCRPYHETRGQQINPADSVGHDPCRDERQRVEQRETKGEGGRFCVGKAHVRHNLRQDGWHAESDDRMMHVDHRHDAHTVQPPQFVQEPIEFASRDRFFHQFFQWRIFFDDFALDDFGFGLFSLVLQESRYVHEFAEFFQSRGRIGGFRTVAPRPLPPPGFLDLATSYARLSCPRHARARLHGSLVWACSQGAHVASTEHGFRAHRVPHRVRPGIEPIAVRVRSRNRPGPLRVLGVDVSDQREGIGPDGGDERGAYRLPFASACPPT